MTWERSVPTTTYRQVVAPRKYVPLDSKIKAEIVRRIETRLWRFIVGHAPTMMARYVCKECGPTNNDGYWFADLTGICDACLKKQAFHDPWKAEEDVWAAAKD